MTTVDTLIDIEKILLSVDSANSFSYTLNELVKSEKYLKEIGDITSLYFKKQLEYGKTIYSGDYQEKLEEYRNFLKSDRLDIDIDKYIEFIKHIKEKVNDENLLKMINNFLENGRTDD